MALQTSNSSVVVSAFLDCVLDKANISSNASLGEVNSTTCSNGPGNHRSPSARPKDTGSIRILLYSLIFLLSVFGNLLIIVVLMLNKRMRTVTNSFLLSLAVSDLMMAVFCMPFTLIPSILQDFIFGAAMCKIFTYFMGISVSISTFSLVAIAIERYSAICNPLKSRSWQTRSHAYRVIAATWVLSLLIMVPYPVFYGIKTSVRRSDNATIHMCRPEWPGVWVEQTWYMLLLFTLFFVPGVVMMIAYGLISRELYRGIHFEQSLNADTAGLKNSGGSSSVSAGGGHNNDDDGDGCYVHVSKRTPPSSATELRTLSASASAAALQAKTEQRARSNASEAKLRAKKRVVRMLMVIVALFFACWMPLYAANTWKAFDLPSAHRALGGAPISFIQLLAYTSACVNPVIYCFMNTRFRAALLATFACCWCCCGGGGGARLCGRGLWGGRRRRGEGGDDCLTAASSMATSVSRFSYTTVSTAGPC